MNTPETKPSQPAFIRHLAQTYGVSEAAVESLHHSLRRGGGSMAQFSHPDLGGNGQWMQGGMIMVGDMFNQALKAKVEALCLALLPHLNESQSSAATPSAAMFQRGTSDWWPAEYTRPAATGGQNEFRYAYFPQANVLVVEQNGKTEVHDTTGHDLHGFGQQQVSSSGFSMRSAGGNVDLSKLPKKNPGPRE